jgi:hypothetical protein
MRLRAASVSATIAWLVVSVLTLVLVRTTGRPEWGLLIQIGLAALTGIPGAHQRELEKLSRPTQPDR